jgi:DMSO reductase family type II enzyme heme b subunit
MSTRAISRSLASVALASLLAATAVWPATAHAAVTIRALRVGGPANGLDPNAAAWSAATEYTVTLDTVISATGIPQPLPSSKYRYLKVKAIRDNTDIFFRLRWTDSTQDNSVADTTLFADAVALEIPYSANSSIAMGNQFQPVDILYWRADLGDPVTGLGRPQNIVAGGAGTVQKSPESDTLPTGFSQGYAAGAWTVVMQRPLSGAPWPSGDLVTLNPGGTYRITFAQWDGGNKERDGVKLVAGSWQAVFISQ